MEVDVHRDEEALDNHMRMDDLVLGGENRAGASVEPVREHVVSQERPAASGRKFVNVAVSFVEPSSSSSATALRKAFSSEHSFCKRRVAA